MHDPSCVAHEIKYPWTSKCSISGRKRRESFISIWHNDPMDFKGKIWGRDDDSCGWFSPLYTKEENDKVIKLSKSQYRELFAKQYHTRDNESFAFICYDQDAYGAVYWSWRALQAMNKKGYQYGRELNPKELNNIYSLANNPVDNVRSSYNSIKDEETFLSFFFIVWRAVRRYNRPWYKHPRWHIHHWSFQIHPLQALKRRFWDKCCKCGKRGFKSPDYAMGDWSGTKIWHSSCDNISTGAK